MSIFLKKLEDISIDDIKQFINEGHPENIRLEYKQDFSSKDENFQIAKEVSAFANQQGGVILFGVSEKEDRRPDAILGIDKDKDPRKKIQSVCIDHIYPPIFPEISEIELKENVDKVLVVVRIDMSEETPHTINNRTGFYVRGDDVCAPRPMTDEEIMFLSNKRAKLLERREWLLKRTHERVFPSDVKRNYMLTPIMLTAIPFYPSRPLIEKEKLSEVFKKSIVPQSHDFPLYTDSIKTASDSIYGYISLKENNPSSVRRDRYGELNIFGQVSYYENAVREFAPNGQTEISGIWAGYELRNLFIFIRFIGNFYRNLGYWGVIKISCKIENCRGIKLLPPPRTYYYSDSLSVMELDSNIRIERDYYVLQLLDNSDEIVRDIFQDFLWGSGLSIHNATTIPVMNWIDTIKGEMYAKKNCPKCDKNQIFSIDETCTTCKK